jgi:hypothetical protein
MLGMEMPAPPCLQLFNESVACFLEHDYVLQLQWAAL